MAQGVAIKRGSTFYAINLASWKEDVDATTTRIHWSCNIQFGNWYLWGVRLHVAIDGHEVGPWDGACTYRGQVVIDVSGTRDIARGDADRDIKVEAWSESRTVNGYGGVGITTSCHEWQNALAIPYEVPKSPSDMTAWRNSDRQNDMRWKNNPEGVVKKYTQLKVTRTVDGGDWHELKVLSPDAKGNLPTSFTDNDVYANHRYRYAVHAANNAGWTAASHSDYVYTTPSAPSGCGASRSSDTQAKVWWRLGERAEHTYVNVLLERRTDEGGWTQIATLGSGTTNYTDNGISSNHRYDYRVRAYNGLYSDYSTQQDYIYTTPAAPTSVRASATGPTTVSVSASGLPRWADSYQVEHRAASGSWGERKAVESFPVAMASVAGVNSYRVRCGRGGLWSGWRESAGITTVSVPLAPSVSGISAVYALGGSAAVSWSPNHPDGSAQTKAEVEIVKPGGSTSTVPVPGSTAFAEVPLDAAGTWRLRVRTHGAHSDWGAWSGHLEFSVAALPVVTITDPSTDSGVVEVVPFNATWEVVDATGVASQALRLLSPEGSVLHEVELAPAVRSYEFRAGTYLPKNLGRYTVEVSVRGGSTLGATARRSFTADYAEPARPAPRIAYTPELGVDVEVRFGLDSWSVDGWELVAPELLPDEDGIPVLSGLDVSQDGVMAFGPVLPTKAASVVRLMPDGTQWLVSDAMLDGGAARDPLPPLETDYSYLVTAYSEVGTATTFEVPARVAADAVAINFGRAASGFIPLKYNVEWSRDYELSTELMDFADGGEAGGLPTAYTTGSASIKGSLSATALGREDHDALDALARRHAVAWVRDPHGRRALCAIGLGLSGGIPRDVAGVNLSLTETAWREAWDG